MGAQKGGEGISILQAVDNLGFMSESDLFYPLEKEGVSKIAGAPSPEQLEALSWYDPSHISYNQERVQETFKAIHKYLKELSEKDQGLLRDANTQNGIQALMLLVTEAASKIDRFTPLFKGEGESVLQLKEYTELLKFYQTKVLHRFQVLPERKERWQEDWGKGASDELLPVQKRGLNDLIGVRQDREYELFYIRREDGCPFFNRSLLRHIQLVGEFDASLVDPKKEDLFLKLKLLHDRDCHLAAQAILQSASHEIEAYFKQAMAHKQEKSVAYINQAIMALLLAANVANLMSHTTKKSSAAYYRDFHFYLREANALEDVKSSPFARKAMEMAQLLSILFFTRASRRGEFVKWVSHHISHPLEEVGRASQLFHRLREEDAKIRQMLRDFPNGPLMRTLSLFNEEQELTGFDPLAQGNLPSELFTLTSENSHVSCLRLPAPIVQEHIRSAKVVPEFKGFLKALQRHKEHHLLINLQERTSWQEHGRSAALEEFHMPSLITVTLAKSGDFYWQTGVYGNEEDAASFIKALKAQVKAEQQCGYFFPASLDKKEILTFVDQVVRSIHQLFFASKELLTHKNRLDFLEVFSLLLSLKCIEMSGCSSVSFTCKDATDLGACHAAGIFALVRLMEEGKEWGAKEQELLSALFFAPALMQRFRAVDAAAFHRMLEALSLIAAAHEAQPKEVATGLSQLFKVSLSCSL